MFCQMTKSSVNAGLWKGANHAMTSVHDFAETVVPALRSADAQASPTTSDIEEFRKATPAYEKRVFGGSWIAVLAPRQAALDACILKRTNLPSTLLAKRLMFLHDAFDVDIGELA